MSFKPKSVLPRMSLPCLGIALSLSLNPAHAMDNSFPDELLVQTFKQLSIKELEDCELVCTRWKRVLSADDVWEEAARRYTESGEKLYFMFYFERFPPSWKTILKETYRYCKKKKYEETNKSMVDFDKENGVLIEYPRTLNDNPRAPSYFKGMPCFISFQDIKKAQENDRIYKSWLVKRELEFTRFCRD